MQLSLKKTIHFLLILLIVPKKNFFKLIKYFNKSTSQLNQDLFVLGLLNFKKSGFFVEFGACDGKYLSNSFMLEKNFKWSGILSEPCKHWHNELERNRSSIINHNCVWSSSGKEIIFFENSTDKALSGLIQDVELTNTYSVVSISLMELLISNKAPSEIDFISIDTEGTELEIMKSFDFNNFNVKIWCVEHNYNKDKRKGIIEIFEKNGYVRAPSFISRFDDWFYKN